VEQGFGLAAEYLYGYDRCSLLAGWSRCLLARRTVVHQEKLHIPTECDNIMLIESFV
jgi:hypothetical protein